MSSPGRWVPISQKQPPYALEHLQDVHMERVHGCRNRWPELFGWGWAESSAQHEEPRLMDAPELCEYVYSRGANSGSFALCQPANVA